MIAILPYMFILLRKLTEYKGPTLYRSLNAIVAQPKNCTSGVNTTIEQKNITTTFDSNCIRQGMFQLTSES